MFNHLEMEEAAARTGVPAASMMTQLKDLDLDKLAKALAEELEHIEDPALALEMARMRCARAQGEPSGFAGPAGRSDEVEFTADGRPLFLFHKAINYPKVEAPDDKNGYGGPYDTAFQPSIPDSPNVDLFTTEGSFLEKVRQVTARNLYFKDVISIVKGIYPEIKMQFPQPPTYIWNPKNQEQKLEIQKIKNALKVRFPDLEWSSRGMDGVPMAQMDFMDGSSCDLMLGDQANHLTIVYWKPAGMGA